MRSRRWQPCHVLVGSGTVASSRTGTGEAGTVRNWDGRPGDKGTRRHSGGQLSGVHWRMRRGAGGVRHAGVDGRHLTLDGRTPMGGELQRAISTIPTPKPYPPLVIELVGNGIRGLRIAFPNPSHFVIANTGLKSSHPTFPVFTPRIPESKRHPNVHFTVQMNRLQGSKANRSDLPRSARLVHSYLVIAVVIPQ